MKTPWECAPWGMAAEQSPVMEVMAAAMEEEVSTSSWGPSCGIAPCLQTGASSSFSTWTWRSFWLKMEWAACTATTAPVQPRSLRRAPSRPCPTRAPSAYRPHLHLAPHPHHLPPRLPRRSLVWRWRSRRASEEEVTVCMGVRRVWTTPASRPLLPPHPPVHRCWRPRAAGQTWSGCSMWIRQTWICPTSRTSTPGGTPSVKRSSSHSRWSRRLARSWCPMTWRMRSTGPGGIKTMKLQSVPETPAVSRRTKYQCVLPTWREKTPPSDRKWPRSERNWAAVATSLVNTRTVSPTSDEGAEQKQNQEEEENLSWIKFKDS